MKASAPLALLALCLTSPVHAASSQWFEMEGVRIRLLSTGNADADGVLRGALDIELKPGWKTYWRDPGAAGVPPQIGFEGSGNVQSLSLDFPPPAWHDDGFSRWAGYDRPVRLPLSIKLAEATAPARLSTQLFLGICKQICIPVQASLDLAPGEDTDSAEDTEVVQAAWAALPAPASASFGLKPVAGRSADHLTIQAALPAAGDPVVFVASADGYALGLPKRDPTDPQRFSIEIVDRPTTRPDGPGLPYTLVTEQGAVSGYLPYP